MVDAPKRYTPTEYDTIMRELWEVRQLIAEYRGLGRIREDLDIVEKEMHDLKKEVRFVRKMFIKIGTKLFKNAV